MSPILEKLLQSVRDQYVTLMSEAQGEQAFLIAEKLSHQVLAIDADKMISILSEDPTLLAARAGGFIADAKEKENPSVGVIIANFMIMTALDNLLTLAIERKWLEIDSDGNVLVDESELSQERDYPFAQDYSSAVSNPELDQVRENHLTKILRLAEQEYRERLDSEAHDAFQFALEVAANHTVFDPSDLVPLIRENPLLLALRADNLIEDETFADDPPAGIIISAHLTQILLEHLLDIAQEEGALAVDGEGQIILPEGQEDNPTIH